MAVGGGPVQSVLPGAVASGYKLGCAPRATKLRILKFRLQKFKIHETVQKSEGALSCLRYPLCLACSVRSGAETVSKGSH